MADVKEFKNEHVEIKVISKKNMGNGKFTTQCSVKFNSCYSTASVLHDLVLKSGEADKQIKHIIQFAQAGNELAYTYMKHAVTNYDWKEELHKYGQTVNLYVHHNEDVNFEHAVDIHTKAPFPDNDEQESEIYKEGGPGYAPGGWEYCPDDIKDIDMPDITIDLDRSKYKKNSGFIDFGGDINDWEHATHIGYRYNATKNVLEYNKNYATMIKSVQNGETLEEIMVTGGTSDYPTLAIIKLDGKIEKTFLSGSHPIYTIQSNGIIIGSVSSSNSFEYDSI